MPVDRPRGLLATRYPSAAAILALGLTLGSQAGCAAQPAAMPIPTAAGAAQPIPVLAQSPLAAPRAVAGPEVAGPLAALRAAFEREVTSHRRLLDTETHDAKTAAALKAARTMLAATGTRLDRPQLVLLADRSPAVQTMWLVLASDSPSPWPIVGAVRISTGKPGKKEHFRTPIGVFTAGMDIIGYRAQGTLNENGIRGNGVKGMRVWDFGWQTTDDWRTKGALTAVRLEMHATDPTFLESRLGTPASEACIRIPASFNRFIDRNGVLDAQLTAAAGQVRWVGALLPKDATPTPLAGDKVIVVDTSDPAAKPSDPQEALAIEQRFADWLAAQPKTPAPAPGEPQTPPPVSVLPSATPKRPPPAAGAPALGPAMRAEVPRPIRPAAPAPATTTLATAVPNAVQAGPIPAVPLAAPGSLPRPVPIALP